jgi:hypothetical protein
VHKVEDLLQFLTEIERLKISYRLEYNRRDAIMVLIAVPGSRWEVEFFSDGRVELERFGHSSGVKSITSSELLVLLAEYSG